MTHGLHSYPTRMIPQIARRLILRYSSKANLILDPFCGSGSVLAEARLQGRNSIGIDLNPLACILAKAKSTPIEPTRLTKHWEGLKAKIEQNLKEAKEGKLEVNVPDLPNLNYWFKPKVSKELAIIRQQLDEIKGEDSYHFFATCFSITVRKVSNVRQNEFKLYRIPEEKLSLHNPDVFGTFVQHVR